MEKNKINIIFIDGLQPRHNNLSSYIGYLFPIGAILEQNNLSFKILHTSVLEEYSIKSLLSCLRMYKFDAIGMTTNADSIRFVYKICNAIKKEFPNIKIILGGPQVSYSDEKTLQECSCDIIIRHEGESQIVEVLKNIKNGTSYENVEGITCRSHGILIKNKDAVILNLDELPTPQYAIFSDTKYWIIPTHYNQFDTFLKKIRSEYIYFMTGRGCPYKCLFCVEGTSKNSFRYRSSKNVKKDLVYFLEKSGANYIAIGDDTFTSSPKRVKALCEVFIEVQKEYNFLWFCEGRVDVLSKYPEIISMMYNAGLRKLQIGIESGNPSVLDIYKKGITLEQMEAVVYEASKYKDLNLCGNIILGNPNETFQEFTSSLEFIKKLIKISNYKLDITSTYLTPYVGTPIRENPEKYNLEFLIDDFEFEYYGMIDIICKPKSMSVEELNKLSGITTFEILKYAQKNIYEIGIEEINRRAKYYHKLSKGRTPDIWLKTFGNLSSFKIYTEIISRDNIVTEEDFQCIINNSRSISPLRLWDIHYNSDEDKYEFTTLDGKYIEIAGEEKVLWELATGKKSIFQIVDENNNINCKLEDVVSYFIYLKNCMALVLIKL